MAGAEAIPKARRFRRVETLVSVEYKVFLGLVLHLQLKVGLAEVDLGESLSASEGCKDVVDSWYRILVDFQLAVEAHLEISAQANGAVLLGDRDDGRGPLTPIDLGEDAVVLQAIKLHCDLSQSA